MNLSAADLNELTDILSVLCLILAIFKVGWIILNMNDEDEWTRRYVRVLMGFNILACCFGFMLRPLHNSGIIDEGTRDFGAFMLRVTVICVLSLSLLTVIYRKWLARQDGEDP